MIDLNEYTEDWGKVSLKDLSEVALTKRVDNKYVFSRSQLIPLLAQMKKSYKILEINNNRHFQYRTIYFDTPNFQFYLDHHNRRVKRKKVRMREYVDSGLKFYEIKNKLPGQETDKKRFVIDQLADELSSKHYKRIENERFRGLILEKKLTNQFNRMTFAQIDTHERITIDTNIEFLADKKYAEIPNVVVLELKQPRYDVTSDMVQILKKMRIYPDSFSKYVMGVVLLDLHQKQNEFKPQKLKINKL